LAVYNGSFTTVGYVKDPTDVSVLEVSVSSVGSGSSMTVSDSHGDVTGVDPSAGQTVSEIPQSAAFVEGPLENINGSSDTNTTVQFIDIYQADSGSYTINLGGATSQPYVLNLTYVSPAGTVQSQRTITVTATGAPVGYQVYLDPAHTLGPPTLQPATSSLPTPSLNAVTFPGQLPVPQVVDVTGLFLIRVRKNVNPHGRRTRQTLSLRYLGPALLPGPFSLVLADLSSGARFLNDTGATQAFTALGSPYLALNVGGLVPREIANVVLVFNNSTGKPLHYTPHVLAGPVLV
jgi:hypothetical protein